MSMLSRFADILGANINALLDKAEDPAKMIDQYLVKARKDLADVKQETAAVMAEETRAKRMLDENKAEIAKYQVQERLNSLNTALAPFSSEELTMAQEQIDAYKADPMNHEVNEIVNAIYIGIGKHNKELEAAKASEQNEKQGDNEPDGIESEVEPEKNFESSSIF